MRWVYGIFLLSLVALSAAALLRVDWSTQVSTDVMDLIPQSSSSAELEIGRSVLEQLYSKQITILLKNISKPEAKAAYIEALQQSELVATCIDLSAEDAFESAGRFLFESRLSFIFPKWLARAKSATETGDPQALTRFAVEELEVALGEPDIVAYESIIPQDPLLLMRLASSGFEAAAGRASIPADTALLQITVNASTLSAEGQVPVFEVLDAALAAGRVHAPGMTAMDTGAHRYAYETERHMRAEMKWLNASTLLVVLLICILLCRRVVLMLHLSVMLGLSLLVTLACMTYLFDELHVFALIFGSVLCGVIIDYGLHAYLHESDGGERELRTFLRPFWISCGSTLAGFVILVFSDLPVLKQMGAFVSCGLAVASVITLVYVFGLLGGRSVHLPWGGLPQIRARRFWWLPFAGSILGILCLPLIQWNDDIRNLKYPLPELEAQEAEIRKLHGAEQSIFITFGEDFAEARAHLSELEQWLEKEGITSTSYLNAGKWVPGYDDYQEGIQFAQMHEEFGSQLLDELAENGYERSAFEPFATAWNHYVDTAQPTESAYNKKVRAFSQSLAGVLQGIIGSHDQLTWWITLVDQPGQLRPLPDGINTLALSQVEQMSEALSGYRSKTLHLSQWAGGTILIILLSLFRWKAGLLIATIPALAVLATALALSFLFGPLGIFQLVGMFLGGCLVLDYAVFTWIGCESGGCMPFSVLVSALTTGASFGILSFSQIVAIHALGAAVASVTLIGFILAFCFIPGMVRRLQA